MFTIIRIISIKSCVNLLISSKIYKRLPLAEIKQESIPVWSVPKGGAVGGAVHRGGVVKGEVLSRGEVLSKGLVLSGGTVRGGGVVWEEVLRGRCYPGGCVIQGRCC